MKKTHHLYNIVFRGRSCQIELAIRVTEFPKCGGSLQQQNDSEQRILRVQIATCNIQRHTRTVSQNGSRPIDVCDIAQYPGAEPYPANDVNPPKRRGNTIDVENVPVVRCVVLTDGDLVIGRGAVVSPCLLVHHLPCNTLRALECMIVRKC